MVWLSMTGESTEARLARLTLIEARLESLQLETASELEALEASHPGPLAPLEQVAGFKAEAARLLGRQEILSSLAALSIEKA